MLKASFAMFRRLLPAFFLLTTANAISIRLSHSLSTQAYLNETFSTTAPQVTSDEVRHEDNLLHNVCQHICTCANDKLICDNPSKALQDALPKFPRPSAVKTLVLKRNYELTDLEAFKVLTELRRFSMTRNSKSLPPNALRHFGKLEVLDLSYQKATKFVPKHFKGLENLKVLNLSHNHLHLGKGFFGFLPNLEELILSGNHFGYADPRWFKGLENLRKLDISSNGIGTVKGISKYLPNLRILNLRDNDLALLTGGKETVEELDISLNSFKTLRKRDFAKMVNLTALWADELNELTSIEEGTFTDLNLEVLSLENCPQLRTIDSSALPGNDTLHELHLRNNNLTTITEGAFTNLHLLRLEGNRLHCDQNTVWLAKKPYIDLIEGQNLVCSSPPQLEGQFIELLSPINSSMESTDNVNEFIRGENVSEFIRGGPQKAMALMNSGIVDVEGPDVDSSVHPTIGALSANMFGVALGAALLVMFIVLSIFYVNRDRIRRFVRGENRRVGSVYYVRPGASANQPTDV